MARPNVTIAGFSTANEMCEVFVWYYPKIPMLACSSFYDINRLLSPFGIKRVRWLVTFIISHMQTLRCTSFVDLALYIQATRIQ